MESAMSKVVTSYTEVWIEINFKGVKRKIGLVTSYTEVWIEIRWESGKSYPSIVTSYTEVWIEISQMLMYTMMHRRHLLYGGVD